MAYFAQPPFSCLGTNLNFSRTNTVQKDPVLTFFGDVYICHNSLSSVTNCF